MITRKSYLELVQFETFEDRINYLLTKSSIGIDTFGGYRYAYESFLKSYEWIHFRRKVIDRDRGCDLGLSDFPIDSKPIIHHINPIAIEDVLQHNPCLLDMNNVITVSHRTHMAIHYGDGTYVKKTAFDERVPGDTCPWKY